jgi:4-hydroxy-3-methylbut-2-enyl diphosphate reductase
MAPDELPERVTVLSPGGFCAGVETSIKALAWMIEAFPGQRVYCYHDIVHNTRVVDIFSNANVTFVSSIDQVPDGAPLMLSAHGSSPAVIAQATAKTPYLVDAVCPLVRKVHKEVVNQSAAGHRIVYLGHPGHDEAVGTLAIAPDDITLVETVADIELLQPDARPISVLTQTTLSDGTAQELTSAVKARLGTVWEPESSDRCFATTNRQAAVRAYATQCDAMIIVGARQSSNTRAMETVAREAGCRNVQRVNDKDEIAFPLGAHVAVAASASAPEQTVREITEFLTGGDASRIGSFALPIPEPTFRAPRDMLTLVSTGESYPSLDRVNDPSVTASAMMAELTP